MCPTIKCYKEDEFDYKVYKKMILRIYYHFKTVFYFPKELCYILLQKLMNTQFYFILTCEKLIKQL